MMGPLLRDWRWADRWDDMTTDQRAEFACDVMRLRLAQRGHTIATGSAKELDEQVDAADRVDQWLAGKVPNGVR